MALELAAVDGLALGFGAGALLDLPLATEYPIMATGVLLCPGVRVTTLGR